MGLDIATTSALAVDDVTGGRPSCVTMTIGDYEGTGPKLARFEDWLCDQIEFHAPEVVAIEAPLIPGGNALMTRAETVLLLIKLSGVAELVAERFGRKTMLVNVARVKKHFTGSGRAEKADMLKRCADLRWPVRNHNEADACGVWSLAKATIDPKWAPMATPLFARAS